MPEIHFDRYYRYDDLTRLLHAYAAEYPNLVSLTSIGKSYEGREIWLATVTNRATGPADEKPALWVDGNIHASEVSASALCLYLLNKITTQYGHDADITRCLDTRAFYICPRIGVDGAELALADTPVIVRSGTRPYPFNEDPVSGLVERDINGDGRILQVRIPDPNGMWKKHPTEPRLMIRRDPTEVGGEYYHIVPEGMLLNYDGVRIAPARRKEGLDFNRNFPADWRQEAEQSGAGPYPTSETEVRAVVDFIAKHPNITGALAFHTWSGVLLRPPTIAPDDSIPVEDLWTFQKIGEVGTRITGYPAISNFHEFKYHPKEIITGTSDDWQYSHLGLYTWVVEIWSPQRQAGITSYKYIDWYREHPLEDDLKMLQWSDEKLGGKGYNAWTPYDHPQLGPVEIGGWDHLYAWRNPPAEYLEKEIAPFADWLVWHLLISPRLELLRTAVTPLGAGRYHVQIVVQNTGWLPTYVTKRALERKVARGLVYEVSLPEGAKLVTGKVREEGGHLEGRAYANTAANPWSVWRSTATDDRTKQEWVIDAPNGGEVAITARLDRAGTVRVTVKLSE